MPFLLMTEDAKVGGGGGDCKVEIDKILLSKNSNRSISYLIPTLKKLIFN